LFGDHGVFSLGLLFNFAGHNNKVSPGISDAAQINPEPSFLIYG